MKPLALLPLVLLTLAGCGGHAGTDPEAGIKVVYSVTPDEASAAPAGTVALKASVLEGFYSDLAVSVREGAAGGTVVKTASGVAATNDGPVADGATYTAPSAPGTYHVDVRFLSGTKVEATETATIIVTSAP